MLSKNLKEDRSYGALKLYNAKVKEIRVVILAPDRAESTNLPNIKIFLSM